MPNVEGWYIIAQNILLIKKKHGHCFQSVAISFASKLEIDSKQRYLIDKGKIKHNFSVSRFQLLYMVLF